MLKEIYNANKIITPYSIKSAFKYCVQKIFRGSVHQKKSHKQEASLVKTWLNTHIATKPIATIKPSDLIRIKSEWETHLAPATIARRFALLSNLFTIARKDWLWTFIQHNPVELIRLPQIRNERNRRTFERIKVLGSNPIESPSSEINWIIRETKSKTLPTIINLAVETAMRRSELINIRREDIDFEQGTIYIADSKNGNSRYVPLSPLARYTLITYISKHNPKNKLFNMTASGVSRAFVRSRRKARLKYEFICATKEQAPNPAYLKDLRFHDLRHEATSRLAEIYEMHELAKITGHRDTRMLLRYYHPDVIKLTQKLAQSRQGQEQFNAINQMLLQLL